VQENRIRKLRLKPNLVAAPRFACSCSAAPPPNLLGEGEEARGKNSVYVFPKKENEPIKYKDNDILKFSNF
jgi:hypothetical protein